MCVCNTVIFKVLKRLMRLQDWDYLNDDDRESHCSFLLENSCKCKWWIWLLLGFALFVLEPLRVSCQVGPLNEVARKKRSASRSHRRWMCKTSCQTTYLPASVNHHTLEEIIKLVRIFHRSHRMIAVVPLFSNRTMSCVGNLGGLLKAI